MTTLKFVDSHNMVAFLSKPAKNEEPCQDTVKAKNVNGEVQLQTLVDGKKIIITESIVRRDLQLEDAEVTNYEAIYKERDDSLVRAAKGRKIHDIDADEDITLVNDQDMFDVNDLA
ncbi:hypothetical protein Tco_0417132, partial [Tanacetum coccineum]